MSLSLSGLSVFDCKIRFNLPILTFPLLLPEPQTPVGGQVSIL